MELCNMSVLSELSNVSAAALHHLLYLNSLLVPTYHLNQDDLQEWSTANTSPF